METTPSPAPSSEPSRRIEDLLALMHALRTPGTGCPWDLEQTFASIARYTIEEAYEVADAIARNDTDDLCDELGDLLLQVVFHARIAEEAGHFAFADVVEAITGKLIRRHPHVFSAARDLAPEDVKALWASIKADEKHARALRRGAPDSSPASILGGVSNGLPPTQRAVKLQAKAAAVGFEWPNADGVVDKAEEELRELRDAVASGDKARITDELGDVMFVLANLARRFDIDPDMALASTNAKFERRFSQVEASLHKRGLSPQTSSLSDMEAAWQDAKAAERRS
jgi:ATP diphosphatase